MIDVSGDLIERAGLEPVDFNDSYRGALIMRMKRVLHLAGIDAETYERLLPKRVDRDPLFREMGLYAPRKRIARKRSA